MHRALRGRPRSIVGAVWDTVPVLALTLALGCSGFVATRDDAAKPPVATKSDSASAELSAAILHSDLERVRALIDGGVDVDARLEAGLTALQMARMLGDREIAELLIAKGADEDAELPPPPTLIERALTSTVERATSGGVAPAVAVLVARGGEIIVERAFGCASIDPCVPATPATKFRIGSVSKQFTAAAILALRDQGKLALDDRLEKYYPGFPRGADITLRHLLHHTSGIRSYTDKPGFLERVTAPIAPEDLIAWFRDDERDFEPGTQWKYNNSGYFLLGEIVAKVSGLSFAEFLRAAFFEPLGMKDSGVYDNAAPPSAIATGLSWNEGKLERAVDWDMSWAGGAGALYSTVRDLHIWNEALWSGKALSARSLEEAWTPLELPGAADAPRYGFGWAIGEHRGLEQIAHSGGLHGFLSVLVRYPDEKTSVAVLVNCSPPAPGIAPEVIAQQVATMLLWQTMSARSPALASTEVKPEELDDYAGEYDYGAGVMIIRREENRLFAQLTGQPEWEIFARGDGEFVWRVVEASVRFVRGDDGRVTHLVHRQGGNEFEAEKLSGREVAEVDPAVYDKYIGKYQYPGAVLEVTRDGDRLWAQMTGQPKLEILPSSATKFFWKSIHARIDFLTGDEGRVIAIEHEQGGRKFRAPRL